MLCGGSFDLGGQEFADRFDHRGGLSGVGRIGGDGNAAAIPDAAEEVEHAGEAYVARDRVARGGEDGVGGLGIGGHTEASEPYMADDAAEDGDGLRRGLTDRQGPRRVPCDADGGVLEQIDGAPELSGGGEQALILDGKDDADFRRDIGSAGKKGRETAMGRIARARRVGGSDAKYGAGGLSTAADLLDQRRCVIAVGIAADGSAGAERQTGGAFGAAWSSMASAPTCWASATRASTVSEAGAVTARRMAGSWSGWSTTSR